jgi:hypothetical protein
MLISRAPKLRRNHMTLAKVRHRALEDLPRPQATLLVGCLLHGISGPFRSPGSTVVPDQAVRGGGSSPIHMLLVPDL